MLYKVIDRQKSEVVENSLTWLEAMDYQQTEEDKDKYQVVKDEMIIGADA